MDDPKTKSVAIHLRIPKALDKELDDIAEQTGRSKQELMRLVMDLGLVAMKTNEFDVGLAYVTAHTKPDLIKKALELLCQLPTSPNLPNVLPLRKEVDFNKLPDPAKEKVAESK